MHLMTDKMVRRVDADTYQQEKGHFDKSGMGFVEYQPGNFTGGYQPLGMSAADKERNIKATVEDIRDRLGCC